MDIKHIIKYTTYLITRKQSETQSFEDHNADFVSSDFIKRERAGHKDNDAHNNLDIVGFTTMVTPSLKKMTAVDIGSGSGYYSAKFSKVFKRVIAIEPSSRGIEVAQILYPKSKFKNINWQNGFAQIKLANVSMKEPLFFFTGTVLSHLPDSVVEKICKHIARAKKGSILLFNECFGVEHHRYMWHVRTQEWWQKQLPGWEIDFFGEEIQGVKGRRKGIRAIKVK